MGEKTEAQKRAQQKYMEKFVRVEIRMGADKGMRYKPVQTLNTIV